MLLGVPASGCALARARGPPPHSLSNAGPALRVPKGQKAPGLRGAGV